MLRPIWHVTLRLTFLKIFVANWVPPKGRLYVRDLYLSSCKSSRRSVSPSPRYRHVNGQIDSIHTKNYSRFNVRHNAWWRRLLCSFDVPFKGFNTVLWNSANTLYAPVAQEHSQWELLFACVLRCNRDGLCSVSTHTTRDIARNCHGAFTPHERQTVRRQPP